MTERKCLMWEVNVWYLVWIEHPEWFDAYKGEHNESILFNY